MAYQAHDIGCGTQLFHGSRERIQSSREKHHMMWFVWFEQKPFVVEQVRWLS